MLEVDSLVLEAFGSDLACSLLESISPPKSYRFLCVSSKWQSNACNQDLLHTLSGFVGQNV